MGGEKNGCWAGEKGVARMMHRAVFEHSVLEVCSAWGEKLP
jgi:hypothetical protein